MNHIKRNNCLEKYPAKATPMLIRVICQGVAMLSLSVNGVTSDVGSYPGNSLSFGAFRAPSHQRDRGFRYGVTNSESDRKAEDAFEAEEYAFNMTQSHDGFVPVEERHEKTDGWRGYLQEKGPSKVFVEVEVEQEIKPLSDEVWDLIMGKNMKSGSESDLVPKDEMVKEDSNAEQNSEDPLDDNRLMVDASANEDPQGILKDEEDEDSANSDDASETYQQLIELFNRPVFVTPTEDFDDADTLISFEVPEPSPDSTIRDGSRARFEIRR